MTVNEDWNVGSWRHVTSLFRNEQYAKRPRYSMLNDCYRENSLTSGIGTKRSLMVSSSMPESSRSNAQTDSTYPPFLPDCYFQAHGFPLSDGLSIGAEKLPSKVVQFGGQKLLQAESPITHKIENNIFIVPRFFLCSLAIYSAA